MNPVKQGAIDHRYAKAMRNVARGIDVDVEDLVEDEQLVIRAIEGGLLADLEERLWTAATSGRKAPDTIGAMSARLNEALGLSVDISAAIEVDNDGPFSKAICRALIDRRFGR